MALLLTESFDWVGTAADLVTKGWTGVGALTASGRTNGGWQPSVSNSSANTIVLSAAGETEWYMGFAFKMTTYPSGGGFPIAGVVRLVSFGGPTSADETQLVLTTSGKLQIRDSANSLVIETTVASMIVTGTWYYIEVRVGMISGIDATNIIQIRVNGILFASSEVLNPWFSVGDDLVNVKLGYNTTSSTYLTSGITYDDVYVCNTVAGVTGFQNDTHVYAQVPDGNGTTNQWVGSDADSTDNYLLVDELTINDADYVQSSVDDDIDLYTFGTVVSDVYTPIGVQQTIRAVYVNAAKKIAMLAKLSATTDTGSDLTLTNSWAGFTRILESKPGGGAWTVDDFNSTEFGVKARP